jgi:hypothetical protein
MATATTRVGAFLPFVLPHIFAAPRPLVELSLRMSAIEFCERAKAWRHIISAEVTTQAATAVAPDYSAIHQIESATLDGLPLTPITHTEVLTDGLSGEPNIGQPKYITQSTPNEVQIYPFAPGTLRLSVILKPRAGQLFGTDASDPLHDAYNVVPEFLLSQHGETIAYGALARMFIIPGEAWTDPNRAAYYRQEFERRSEAAHPVAIKGQQRAPIRTKPHWF